MKWSTAKNSKGFTLQLEVVPINGRIVLRQPLDEPVRGDDDIHH